MKCPICGGNLSIYFMNSDECDGEYRNHFEGSCYNCGKFYEWFDIYEYTDTTPPHEINENDHL